MHDPKKLILFPLLVIVHSVVPAQTFTGGNTHHLQNYNCVLTIHKDSTVAFVYNCRDHPNYAEHTGKIKRIFADTVYRVSSVMTIGQFLNASPPLDTFFIFVDSAIAHQFKITEVTCRNTKYSQLQGYKLRAGNSSTTFKIPLVKNGHNQKNDFVIINTNQKSLITGKVLSFKIPVGSSVSFTAGRQTDFIVVINNGQMITVGEPPLQAEHFKLLLSKQMEN